MFTPAVARMRLTGHLPGITRCQDPKQNAKSNVSHVTVEINNCHKTGHGWKHERQELLDFWTHLKTETDPFTETSYFLVSRIPNDGKSPKNQ
jgi:hypothetical protein